MDLTRCLGISSSVEGVIARKEAAMNETSVETVAQRLRSVEWRQRRLQRGITMFLAGITALARAGLICILFGIPWGEHGFGVDVSQPKLKAFKSRRAQKAVRRPPSTSRILIHSWNSSYARRPPSLLSKQRSIPKFVRQGAGCKRPYSKRPRPEACASKTSRTTS